MPRATIEDIDFGLHQLYKGGGETIGIKVKFTLEEEEVQFNKW